MPTPPKDTKARDVYDAYLAQIGVERFPHLDAMDHDFRGADLSDLNLGDANMRGANLEGVKFRNANLAYVSFAGANLDNADFEGADIADAEFNRTTARNASFRRVWCGPMDAIRSDFRGTDFTDADMNDSAFMKCDLRGTMFCGVKLSSNFEGSRLHGADFTGATGSVTRGLVDVGENEPRLPKQSEFIEWLHAHGAVNITKYIPPGMKPEDLEEWLSLEE